MLWYILENGVNWWVVSLGFLPIWLLQNAIHECSHALMISKSGWGCQVYLFPHKHEGKFFWARIDYIRLKSSLPPLTLTQKTQINIAPRIANIVANGIAVLLFFLGIVFQLEWMVTIGFMLHAAQLVDGFVGIIPAFVWWEDRHWTDIVRFQKSSGLSRWECVICCILFYAFLLFFTFLSNPGVQ